MTHNLIPRLLIAGALVAPASLLHAAELEVRVTNLTRGIHFTPLLVATHPQGTALFGAGQPASASLRAMAEGGDTAALQADLAALGAAVASDPAGGLLAPGASATATLQGGVGTANTRLSVVAMMLPTNDGFIGLDALAVPSAPGTYTYNLNAYDAGTEANDEKRGSGVPGEPGFPVPPPIEASTPTGGAGLSASAEGFVHIHRGVLGDTDPAGGATDIDSTRHRWLNPVARVVLVVR